MRFGFRSSATAEQKAKNRMGGISHDSAKAKTADYLIGPYNQPQDTINEIIEMTGAIPLFDKIDSVQVGIIAEHMQIVHLDEQQRLFAEGEKSDYMCFIVSGTLDVFKQSQAGKKISVSILSRGRSIGEMALIDSYPRSATVIARTPCTLLAITRKSFEHILDERPRAGISFMRALSQILSLHLRKTSGQLVDACESTGSVALNSAVKDKAAKHVASKGTRKISFTRAFTFFTRHNRNIWFNASGLNGLA